MSESLETEIVTGGAPLLQTAPAPMYIMHYFPRIRREEGGVVQVVIDLCQMLASWGHRVLLATCDASDVPGDWISAEHNPSLQLLDLSPGIPGRLSNRGVRRFSDMIIDADVVHLHTPWELSNLQLAKASRKLGVPYVVSVHGMLDDYCMRQKHVKKRAFLALGGRRLFTNATTVHFTATAEREQASRWIAGDFQRAVQPCALDLTPYETLPGPQAALAAFPQLAGGRPTVLFLSRVHPKKGLELLIESAVLLREQGLEFNLAIAGPGDDDYLVQLKKSVKEHGLEEFTYFLGMVRGEVKISLYELADVFVLPTFQENFGLVLPEALACRTPVVTTRGTDIWQELAEAGAQIVDHTPRAIADGVADLLRDFEKRDSLGKRGRDCVLNWLAKDKVAAGYEKMYRDAIACAKATCRHEH